MDYVIEILCTKIYIKLWRPKVRIDISFYFGRISKNTNKNHKPYTKKIIFINIDPRKIKFISLDLSYQDDSNEPKMIKIQSLDYLKIEVYRIKNFENTFEISKILRIFI
jgi:hypothetical protein